MKITDVICKAILDLREYTFPTVWVKRIPAKY